MEAKITVQNMTAYPVSLFDEVGYLKLDSNESDFGPSPKVLDALKQISAQDIQYYPFYGELIEKLAELHGVEIDNIILTAGADEALSSILGTFMNAGQSVLTVTPSFVMPKLYSKLSGLNYIEVPYQEKWKFPLNEFLNKIEVADFLYLTTPNSPTGEVLDGLMLETIIKEAGDKGVLIDEVYANYAGVCNLKFLKGRKNVFIVRSFSKDFALAGLRLGYIISDSENVRELRKYISPYNVSTLTVKAGVAALSDLSFFDSVKKEMEKSKEVLANGLEKLGAKVYPSKTNFLCVDFGVKAAFIYKTLLKNKIKVKYFGNVPMLENCFRLAVPRLENTYKLLEALKVRPTIAFDMDGVLVDASKSYRVAVQNTFEHFSGKKIDSQEICEAKKLGGLNNDWDLTNHLLTAHGFDVNYDEIVEVFQAHYKKLADVEEILIDKSFLESLSKEYNLAIFTGRLQEEAFFTLDKHGLKDYFYPIITLDDVGLEHQKPDCLGIEIIKEKILTDKIYYLGDTVDDMICAKSANVLGIGILPPQDKSEDLKKVLKSQSPIAVLDKALDLEEFLKGVYASK